MRDLQSEIEKAQIWMASILRHLADVGMTEDQYLRYLCVQYYLTKDVQRYFIVAASHADFAARRELRDYLYHIGIEEELHYQVAENDVRALNREMPDEPLDVRLWHLYYTDLLETRPLVRIGAHCILENIVSGQEKAVRGILSKAPYASPQNTRFLLMHLHEEAPHGNDIMRVLRDAELTEDHRQQLVDGAHVAEILFRRMIEWCLAEPEADTGIPVSTHQPPLEAMTRSL